MACGWTVPIADYSSLVTSQGAPCTDTVLDFGRRVRARAVRLHTNCDNPLSAVIDGMSAFDSQSR